MDYLPVYMQLQGQPAVVVGGGRIALRKVELLRKAGARVPVVAPHVTEELRQWNARGEIQYIEAPFEPRHLDGAIVAIAATQIREVNAKVSHAARARRVPVNVVDDPQLSTFIFP